MVIRLKINQFNNFMFIQLFITAIFAIMSHSATKTKPASKTRESNRNKGTQKSEEADLFYEKINLMQLEPLKNFQIPILTTIVQRFYKQIQTPIQLQTSIFNSKSLQRCLEHNNISTLYCISDKKPLCVTCMYQNNQHKKHKVVPLNRASRQLQEQKSRCFNIIENELQVVDRLINRSHNNLSRCAKQFSDTITNINNFYKELQQLMKQKNSQQIMHVQKIWQKMKYQYSTFAEQFSKIKIFLVEKINQIKKRQGQEFLLFNRNICSNLIKIQQIINPDLCPYHETCYSEEIKKFRNYKIQIDQHLVLRSPFKQKVKRQKVADNVVRASSHSKRILQSMQKMNQPVGFFNYDEKENKGSQNHKTVSKGKQKNTFLTPSKSQRKSSSPAIFKPVAIRPAVSAHKPPPHISPSKLTKG